MDDRGKKIRLSAPQYIDYVMTYAQRAVGDESTFPTKFARDFPATFEQTLRKIHRLIFHTVAHLYHQHFRELLLLGGSHLRATLMSATAMMTTGSCCLLKACTDTCTVCSRT